MTIQVWVDESIDPEPKPLFVFAAVIGSAENWLSLSDEWKAVLDESPSMDVFKMNLARRDVVMKRKLESLVPVMKAHPFVILGG